MKCKYCGKEEKGHSICTGCYKKLPQVRELVEICQRIKALVKSGKNTK
jgi:hypothetical protein